MNNLDVLVFHDWNNTFGPNLVLSIWPRIAEWTWNSTFGLGLATGTFYYGNVPSMKIDNYFVLQFRLSPMAAGDIFICSTNSWDFFDKNSRFILLSQSMLCCILSAKIVDNTCMLTDNIHLIFEEIINPTVYTHLFPKCKLEHIDPRNNIDNLLNASMSSHQTDLATPVDKNKIKEIREELNKLENPNLETPEDAPEITENG